MKSKFAHKLDLEEKVVNAIKPRTIVKEGAFLIPYISPGMNMLEVGCGSGSMSQGFAHCLYPGSVTGIDINAEQITLARTLARQENMNNLDFHIADVYALPFDNECFDLVFAHNLFIHLSDPPNALKELHRVCKTGGLVGFRDGLGGFCYYSDFPLRHKYHDLNQFIGIVGQFSDGNPAIGVQLKGLLQTAGFSDLKMTTFSEVYDKPADMVMLKSWYQGLMQGWMGELALLHGLISQQELNQLIASMDQWESDPAALNVILWIEHIAKKISLF